jgi:hypothetical protein
MQRDVETRLGASYQQLAAVDRAVRGIALDQPSHEADRYAVPLFEDYDLGQAAARLRSEATRHPEEQPDR